MDSRSPGDLSNFLDIRTRHSKNTPSGSSLRSSTTANESQPTPSDRVLVISSRSFAVRLDMVLACHKHSLLPTSRSQFNLRKSFRFVTLSTNRASTSLMALEHAHEKLWTPLRTPWRNLRMREKGHDNADRFLLSKFAWLGIKACSALIKSNLTQPLLYETP